MLKVVLKLALGRLTNDCVTTAGSGVDTTVLQLATQFEVRGMTSRLTSYSSAMPNSGTIVNDVRLSYNSFSQIISDAQSHSGAVVLGTTPMVQYGFADGSSNTVRPQTLTYPNGRVVTTGYGTSGGINDACSRVDNLSDSSATLVSYSYLGSSLAATVTYPEPNVQYTLCGSSSGNSPAGDIYWGLDLFGRIIDSRWYNVSSSVDLDRIKYGYDRSSNRIWRQNPVATAAGAEFDEYYTNDGLERLKSMQRGALNGTSTGVTSPTFAQCWTLDSTGNWRGFNESTNGSSWTTIQSRTANSVNEITGITSAAGGSWANPAYDASGNMTTIPQPTAPSSSYSATYDAWNRLVSLSVSGSVTQHNAYDARTFRIEIVTPLPDSTHTRHCYYSAGWQTLGERTDAATTADRQFVWGVRYIDDLVLRDDSSQRLYAMQDANWNVTSIIGTDGVSQERYSYSAYGNTAFLSGLFAAKASSSFDWRTLYCGYTYDSTSGIYSVRYRQYDSSLGVWCQRDPIGYSAGLNDYGYVNQRPLTTFDSQGLQEGGQKTIYFWVNYGDASGAPTHFDPARVQALVQQAFNDAGINVNIAIRRTTTPIDQLELGRTFDMQPYWRQYGVNWINPIAWVPRLAMTPYTIIFALDHNRILAISSSRENRLQEVTQRHQMQMAEPELMSVAWRV